MVLSPRIDRHSQTDTSQARESHIYVFMLLVGPKFVSCPSALEAVAGETPKLASHSFCLFFKTGFELYQVTERYVKSGKVSTGIKSTLVYGNPELARQ
jgi:hypothetical protein